MIVLSKIDQVAEETDDGGLIIDRGRLREAIYQTSDFAGVTGTLGCDEFGDCGAQTISVVLNNNPASPERGISNVVYRYGSQGPLPLG